LNPRTLVSVASILTTIPPKWLWQPIMNGCS
jgi:hypothetical protein